MITTSRNRFIAGHVTPSVKKALKLEADKRGVSVSQLIFQLLSLALKKMGYEIKKEESDSISFGVRLV